MSDNINGQLSARKLKPAAVGIFVILTAVCGGAYAAGALGGVFLLALASAMFAVLLLLSDTPLVYMAVPLAFGAAFLWGASWTEALFAVSFVLPGYLLAYIIKKHGKATAALVALSVSFAVCFAAYYAYVLYVGYGSVIGGAQQFFDSYKALVIEQMATLELTTADGTALHPYTAEAIEETLSSVLANLPGIAAVYLACISSITVILMRFILRRLKVAASVIPDGFYVVLPKSWGIMFFVTGAFSMLLPSSGDYAMYRAAAVNLFMLFLGTLAAYGATVIVRRFRAKGFSPMGKLMICFGVIFVIAVAGVFMVAGVSLYGALCAIFPPKKRLGGRT